MYKLLLVVLAPLLVSCSKPDIGYDPEVDPFQQLYSAKISAQREDKLVLLVAGGSWCSWCYILDDYLEENGDLKERFNDTFITVKVYFGDKNYNDDFFSAFPEAYGYPHFWILSKNGKVLGSQNTGALEEGGSYSHDKFSLFVEYWNKALNTEE